VSGAALDAHPGQACIGIGRPRVAGPPAGIVVGSQRQRRQAVAAPARTGLAQAEEGGAAVEVPELSWPSAGAISTSSRPQRGQAALHVLLGQDVDHLAVRPTAEFRVSRPPRRRADVDDDHHVGTHGARHVDRARC
jgi:hypothetical protein